MPRRVFRTWTFSWDWAESSRFRPTGRRYSDLDQSDEVRALCLAAVDGRYRETVWMIGDEVVRARGVVTIGSAQVPALWAHLRWNLLKRPKRHEFDYGRYEAAAAAA